MQIFDHWVAGMAILHSLHGKCKRPDGLQELIGINGPVLDVNARVSF